MLGIILTCTCIRIGLCIHMVGVFILLLALLDWQGWVDGDLALELAVNC